MMVGFGMSLLSSSRGDLDVTGEQLNDDSFRVQVVAAS